MMTVNDVMMICEADGIAFKLIFVVVSEDRVQVKS